MWRIKCGLQDKSKETIQGPASLVPLERMMPGAGTEAWRRWAHVGGGIDTVGSLVENREKLRVASRLSTLIAGIFLSEDLSFSYSLCKCWEGLAEDLSTTNSGELDCKVLSTSLCLLTRKNTHYAHTHHTFTRIILHVKQHWNHTFLKAKPEEEEWTLSIMISHVSAKLVRWKEIGD